ncbi:MAG: DUF305 domain-containing protein [Phenylobacterium sp.]|uniref:DUF305 domain-containing protein n=1 Tax=Phenylobacterium sp. TaxID=1871053 RepID=UPI0027331219|nr:DUF305 domain-containing protein [Phenylobacterium sp.]MDP3748811.1 DUF305 domain-containing protein [Phenylobacterium sp.]
MHDKPYGRLILMALLHFAAMYVLMYVMVDTFANAIPNVNQVYMAGLMTAPMLVFEMLLMGSMYPNRLLNGALLVAGVVVLAGAFVLIRQQTAVGDAQFLRSMIPHHAGAILMCEKAPLRDAEIKRLCGRIVSGQQTEIDWMRARLKALEDS